MKSKDKIFIAIKDDRLPASIASDCFTVTTLLGSVAVGWLLDISALQWIGGLMWLVIFLIRTHALSEPKLTISQARKLLDDLEGQK